MSAKFLTELAAKYNGQVWVLLEPLVFASDKINRVIEVPAGFATNFASVPRLPFAYLLFGGVANEAATLHDYLYSSGIVSRKQADEVFSEAMKATGTAGWRRGPMWFGVRLFGGSHYSQPEESMAP